MKKLFFIVLIAVIIVTGLALDFFAREKTPEISQVCFPSACVNVSIADTPIERGKGLMYVENLPENQGMLFVFEDSANHKFWMKNTLIPLDMIWINKSNHVVYVQEAQPCKEDNCPSYGPEEDSLYVLEVNGKFASNHNITKGMEVKF